MKAGNFEIKIKEYRTNREGAKYDGTTKVTDASVDELLLEGRKPLSTYHHILLAIATILDSKTRAARMQALTKLSESSLYIGSDTPKYHSIGLLQNFLGEINEDRALTHNEQKQVFTFFTAVLDTMSKEADNDPNKPLTIELDTQDNRSVREHLEPYIKAVSRATASYSVFDTLFVTSTILGFLASSTTIPLTAAAATVLAKYAMSEQEAQRDVSPVAQPEAPNNCRELAKVTPPGQNGSEIEGGPAS